MLGSSPAFPPGIARNVALRAHFTLSREVLPFSAIIRDEFRQSNPKNVKIGARQPAHALEKDHVTPKVARNLAAILPTATGASMLRPTNQRNNRSNSMRACAGTRYGHEWRYSARSEQRSSLIDNATQSTCTLVEQKYVAMGLRRGDTIRGTVDCSTRLLSCRYRRSITSVAIIHAWRGADAGVPDYSAAMRGASVEVPK
jgi:hypothetical protein